MNELERSILEDIERKTNEMHSALMVKSPTGDPPLVDRMSVVVNVFERSSWAGKLLVRTVLTVGAIVVAIGALITSISQYGGGPK